MKGQRDQAAREKVLEALRAGRNVTEATRAAGVHRGTPYQWAERGDAEIAAALAAGPGRGRATQQAKPRAPVTGEERPKVERLREAALDRLLRIIEDDGQRASDHVAAAKAALALSEQAKAASPSAPSARTGSGRTIEERQARLLNVLKGSA
jgi:LmbE family N-acetylglucosaminyl deacetylase